MTRRLLTVLSSHVSVLLSDYPDVVVATPSRALNLVQSKVRISHTPIFNAH